MMNEISAPSVSAGTANMAPAEVAPANSNRHHLLIALAVAMLWLLFWYRDTVMAMVSIWDRSDTFAHGYVVAPISLWLIWRERHRFFQVDVAPSWVGMVAGVCCGMGWLLGQIASVDALAQFALVGMMISLVWAVLGAAVVRTYAFALGFLFFMVPFGEFLFPTMMDWTSHFIIAAVRASGVPVYAEGRSLVIPSGSWQVVEGCSGVRYLIASIVVGSLYAYLNYRSLTRRIVFVMASIIMPVVANWLRAYLIVMIGHLSGNKLATGVDHIIYGWVFFGIVIAVLFMVGARWREDLDEPGETGAMPVSPGLAPRSRAATAGLVGLAVVSLLAWKPVLAVLDARVSTSDVTFALPAGPEGWQVVSDDRMADWTPSFGGMRATLRRTYAAGAEPVGVYVAYYRDQSPGQELINSENRVLISKHPVWKQTAYGTTDVDFGGSVLPARFVDMRSPQTRQIVWMSYWIGNRWTTSDVEAKIYLAVSKLLGRGDDSAAVMFYTQFEGEGHDEADQRLRAFAKAFGPELKRALEAEMPQ